MKLSPPVWRPDARWIGYGVVLIALVGLFIVITTARANLISHGDLNTYDVLTEGYHWYFVTRPFRADDAQSSIARALPIMYPLTSLAFAPNMLLQKVLGGASQPQAIYNISIALLLLLFSLTYFVALSEGVGAKVSAAITLGVMMNPLSVSLLIFAPIIHSAGLLIPGYLLFRRGHSAGALVCFVAAAFSYRAGGLFVLLFLLATPAADTPDGGKLRRTLIIAMGAVFTCQVLNQLSLPLLSDALFAVESSRIANVFNLLLVVAGVTEGNALGLLGGQVLAMVAFVAAAGWPLLLRGNRYRWLLFACLASYVCLVVGPVSQTMLFLVAFSGLALSHLLGAGETSGKWPKLIAKPYRAALLACGPALVVAMSVPYLPAPGTSRDRTTAAGYVLKALEMQEQQPITAIRALLTELDDEEMCAVDWTILPLLERDHCRRVITLGLTAPEEALARADAILVDESRMARQLRSRLTKSDDGGQLAARSRATAALLEAAPQCHLVATAEGASLYRCP